MLNKLLTFKILHSKEMRLSEQLKTINPFQIDIEVLDNQIFLPGYKKDLPTGN